MPAFKLPPPFAGPPIDVKGKGRATDTDGSGRAEADETEVEDVLYLGSLPKVGKWLSRVCDVKSACSSLERCGIVGRPGDLPDLPPLLTLIVVAEGIVAYRFSSIKTHAYLRRKAERLARKDTYERFAGLSKMLAKDGLVGLEASEEGAVPKGELIEKDVKEEARLESIREGESLSHLTCKPAASLTILIPSSSEQKLACTTP